MKVLRVLAFGAVLIAAIGAICFVVLSLGPPPPPRPLVGVSSASDAVPSGRRPTTDAGCAAAPAFDAAAAANGRSLSTARWSVAGPVESGWRGYAALVAREVGAACAADQPALARAVARWQGRHGLPSTGVVSAETLRAMNLIWLRRRPFVAATLDGGCPPPPPDDALVQLRPDESYGGKIVRLQVRALDAYRRLVAAARADRPDLARDPRVLMVFSGYRGPDEEAARCSSGAPCGTVAKARCSAHRTGTALDLFLGSAPGEGPDAADDVNRAYQAQTPAYLWLVANAGRFGFVPYPYEPWHWEFTG